MKNLSALVNNVLEQSKSKIASAVDAPRPKLAAVEQVIAPAKTAHDHDEDCEEGKPPKKMKPEEKRASAISTAQDALKLAENMTQLSALFPKIAAEMPARLPGQMENFKSPTEGTTKDSPTKATSLSHEMASSGGDGSTSRDLKTNRHDAPYAKQAAQTMLDAKLAQAEALKAVGNAAAAEKLAHEAKAEFEAAKKAYEEEDPQTRTPKGNPQTLPLNRKPGDLPVPSGPARDNAGMASMTKRDAKTNFVRQGVSPHIKEPALSSASDKGLTDNLDHTEGAKIASPINVILEAVKNRKTASATQQR